jgi:S-adenosylmethionine:tRNA ribosyltransferase-isomerase
VNAPVGMRLAPARWPTERRRDTKLLVCAAGTLVHARVDQLPEALRRGDLLVVNDAATLPASFAGRVRGAAVELRLLARGATEEEWSAVAFGAGDWHTPTEHRPAPHPLAAGDRIELDGFSAHVERVRPESPRLVEVRFDRGGAALWLALYRAGRPVQYSYLEANLDLWSVQTAYAARPWAVEMPSAGWSLTAGVLAALRAHGVEVAWLTHAAGLSATGDAALDAALPLAERFDIPDKTVAAIARTKARGGRVVAVGTTVVRALEGCALDGALRAGEGVTTLRIGPEHRLRVVDALLTGMHVAGESHFELLRAFAPAELLERATATAAAAGYRCHEFGDAMLLLP